MRLHPKHILTLAVVVALGACAPAEDEIVEDTETGAELTTPDARPPYADWDVDSDAQLARDEFGDWTRERGVFTEWDYDQNSTIGEEEFAGGMLGIWDDNDDEMLSETEWNDNVGDWFDEDHSTFAAWDANADGSLTRDELRQGFVDTEWFGDWDMTDDNELDENEFSDGFFGLFDEDRSGYLDENEWAATDHWTM